MDYQNLYKDLKALFKQNKSCVAYAGLHMTRHSFSSSGYHILSGKSRYSCKSHDVFFEESSGLQNAYLSPLELSDIEINENKHFDYYIVWPDEEKNHGKAILLLHGLNEKSWNKYLPWAWQLSSLTQRPIILFPIAFHMERAPAVWSDSRLMDEFVRGRQSRNPETSNLSFVNSAISYRLTTQPERLFWSGLQTYLDIAELMKKIRNGKIEGLQSQTSIDLFGYSIGAFLSLILLMANPHEYFNESKLFAFCGGATLDRTCAISKYILDSTAAIRISGYFSEQLYNGFRASLRLNHYMNHHISEGHFKFMLNHNCYKHEREQAIRQIAERVLAVPLIKDYVISPVEVFNTLKGDYRTIPTRVEPMDFDFPYDHEHPFIAMNRYGNAVNDSFTKLFEKAAAFYL